MSKITRSDVYSRDEAGGDWFQEFLRSYADVKESSTNQEILEAMTSKQGETVESVVSNYRTMTGLDVMAEALDADEIVATASSEVAKPPRPLSCRAEHTHEEAAPESVIVLIEKDEHLKGDVESLCEHSGGTKETHSILNFLRGKLGSDVVSFSDDDLLEYIEGIKSQYYEEHDAPRGNAGKVGLDGGDHSEGDVAEYQSHGRG